jgi:hypothetical protein
MNKHMLLFVRVSAGLLAGVVATLFGVGAPAFAS